MLLPWQTTPASALWLKQRKLKNPPSLAGQLISSVSDPLQFTTWKNIEPVPGPNEGGDPPIPTASVIEERGREGGRERRKVGERERERERETERERERERGKEGEKKGGRGEREPKMVTGDKL